MNACWIKIVVSVILCLGLGIASGFSTVTEIGTWYAGINKPSWNPPNWLFGPVWTILYILMGISFGMIWNSTHPNKQSAMVVFILQFALNLIWSYLFFNKHLLGVSFIEIVLMLILIASTIYLFYPIHKLAAYLLIPYLIWVSFASVLNGTIWYFPINI